MRDKLRGIKIKWNLRCAPDTHKQSPEACSIMIALVRYGAEFRQIYVYEFQKCLTFSFNDTRDQSHVKFTDILDVLKQLSVITNLSTFDWQKWTEKFHSTRICHWFLTILLKEIYKTLNTFIFSFLILRLWKVIKERASKNHFVV